MTHALIRTALAGSILAVAIPLWAQRGQGGGLGHVAGPVTGAATGAVNATVSQPAGKPGNVPPGKAGNDGPAANGGRGLGVSADLSARVTQNAGLSTELQPLVPPGATLAGAAAGFRNEGQFVAALHVAHNLNIPFEQLKTKMTGDNALSLGKAVQALRPNLDDKSVKDNIKLADRQAERDLEQSEPAGKPDRTGARIASNTQLASRLQALLPPGSTLTAAAAGFKNEGQFIATLEASKSLNLPFADLKDRVTAGQSLGEAIHALKPGLSSEASETAAVHAEEQAKAIRASNP